MTILIEDVEIVGRDGRWNVLVEEGKIKKLSRENLEAEKVKDGSDKVLSPGFFNTHTHAAMSLFRGIADDRAFWDAWPEIVWPVEEELSAEDVYWGTKLACIEMIKTGTVCFNDMYFFMDSALEAVEEMGMKAVLSYGLIDQNDPDKLDDEIEETKRFVEYAEKSDLVKPALGPHAVYTLSKKGLEWCVEYADKKDLLVNIHLGETEKEKEDFDEEYEGHFTDYLEDVGLLNDKLIAAHCVWLEENDYKKLGEESVVVSHNPSSNMKLAVGKPMDYEAMKNADVEVTIGTDGCVSNNNLDMLEEAKIAALQQKMPGDATLLSAEEAFDMITKNGAEAMGFDSGVIEEGKSADLILLDKGVKGLPDHSVKSNLIYSMNGSCVTDTMIDGEFVMENRKVEDEEEILKNATEKAKALVSEVK